MVILPGQKDRMRAREYHWRAGLYICLFLFGRPREQSDSNFNSLNLLAERWSFVHIIS